MSVLIAMRIDVLFKTTVYCTVVVLEDCPNFYGPLDQLYARTNLRTFELDVVVQLASLLQRISYGT